MFLASSCFSGECFHPDKGIRTINGMSYASLSLSAKVCVRVNVQALENSWWRSVTELWEYLSSHGWRMPLYESRSHAVPTEWFHVIASRIRAFSASHVILNNRRCIIIRWGKMPFQFLIVSIRCNPLVSLLICFALLFFCTRKIHTTDFLYDKKC